MAVPLLDLKAQHASLREELEEAVASVVESQHFIGGPNVKAFEGEVGAFLGAHLAQGMVGL